MEKSMAFLGATPSLKQQVYDNLRMRIIDGKLLPGTKLHEEILSSEMGISRAPLREALNMLERDGFATIIPRKGAIVTQISPKDIEDIWTIRELLEPSAAVMSLPYLPQDELDRVMTLLEHVSSEPEDFESYMESDIAVHALMVDHLKNKYLCDILKNLKDHSLRMRWNAEKQNDKVDTDIVLAATKDHIEIVDAMIKQDEKKLFSAVQRHIRVSRKRTMHRFCEGQG